MLASYVAIYVTDSALYYHLLKASFQVYTQLMHTISMLVPFPQ